MTNIRKIKNKLIGTREFYGIVFATALPIMIQNGITTFVSLLDNIMVGRIGTAQMSGVAIVNQLMLVFYLCIFGGVSGAGIFTAQFYGARNNEGIRYTFRFKIIAASAITVIGILIFIFFGDYFIKLYLNESGESGAGAAETLIQSKIYLSYILIGLVPFAISQAYSDTLRSTGETMLPMKAGIVSVLVNLSLNYILIYGKFGAPAMGVGGAALATVISRYCEAAVILIWTHTHSEKEPFIKGAYKSLKIPIPLVKEMIKKAAPLLMNESLWSIGIAALLQNYSVRGLEVIAALNISQIIYNLFNIILIAMGSATAIILGQRLGAGEMKTAKDYAVKMTAFTEVLCIAAMAFLFILAPIFPEVYNTSGEIKALASELIRIVALCMPIGAFALCCYFIIRSGGKTFITFLFDSVFECLVVVPLAYILVHYTELEIIPIYIICQLIVIIKCVIGFIMVKKGIWLNKLS